MLSPVLRHDVTAIAIHIYCVTVSPQMFLNNCYNGDHGGDLHHDDALLQRLVNRLVVLDLGGAALD